MIQIFISALIGGIAFLMGAALAGSGRRRLEQQNHLLRHHLRNCLDLLGPAARNTRVPALEADRYIQAIESEEN